MINALLALPMDLVQQSFFGRFAVLPCSSSFWMNNFILDQLGVLLDLHNAVLQILFSKYANDYKKTQKQ